MEIIDIDTQRNSSLLNHNKPSNNADADKDNAALAHMIRITESAIHSYSSFFFQLDKQQIKKIAPELKRLKRAADGLAATIIIKTDLNY